MTSVIDILGGRGSRKRLILTQICINSLKVAFPAWWDNLTPTPPLPSISQKELIHY